MANREDLKPALVRTVEPAFGESLMAAMDKDADESSLIADKGGMNLEARPSRSHSRTTSASHKLSATTEPSSINPFPILPSHNPETTPSFMSPSTTSITSKRNAAHQSFASNNVESPLSIFLSAFNSRTISLRVHKKEPLEAVFDYFFDGESVALTQDDVFLTSNGKLLDTNKTFCEEGVTNNATIHITLRIRGGGGKSISVSVNDEGRSYKILIREGALLWELKQRLQAKTGIPVHIQKLRIGNKLLDDCSEIRDYSEILEGEPVLLSKDYSKTAHSKYTPNADSLLSQVALPPKASATTSSNIRSATSSPKSKPSPVKAGASSSDLSPHGVTAQAPVKPAPSEVDCAGPSLHGLPFSNIQDNLAALALDPDSEFDLPDPLPQKMRIKDMEVYKIHTLNCLITQVCETPCRILVEARLSLLNQTSEGARYLMRDGCAYAQLLNVPLAASSKIKKGVWYEVVGEAKGVKDGDCGVLKYLGLRKPKRDVRPPFQPPLSRAAFLDDPTICHNCGSPKTDNVHRRLEPHDDCPNPTDPRTLRCSDCGQWGHLWICCPNLVSPSGVLPRVRSPELSLEEWKEFCSFDMSAFGDLDSWSAP